MIIIGSKFVAFEAFYKIKDFEDVKDTPSNATVIFDFSTDKHTLCDELRKNGVLFATIVSKEEDILYANALGSSYIVCDKELSVIAQKWADEYLFDAKILLFSGSVDDRDDLLFCATNSIDGILFSEGVKDGSY